MINKSHWQYFLSLEKELINLSRYIQIDEKNYDTYSLELLKLYLSVSSEVDVVARLLCKKTDSEGYLRKTKNDKKNRNMDTYREIIFIKHPEVSKVMISVDLYQIHIVPWTEFGNGRSPEWWKHYNDVKHTRDAFFHEANLKNVIFSLSGLLVLLNYFCHPMNSETACITLDESTTPKLLMIEGKNAIGGVTWEGARLYLPGQAILDK